MATFSGAILVLLFAASATWLPAQDKVEGSKPPGEPEQMKAPAACAQVKTEAVSGKAEPKLEAITVSVTPFLTSAEPLPLPPIPKRPSKSPRARLKAAAGNRR